MARRKSAKSSKRSRKRPCSPPSKAGRALAKFGAAVRKHGRRPRRVAGCAPRRGAAVLGRRAAKVRGRGRARRNPTGGAIVKTKGQGRKLRVGNCSAEMGHKILAANRKNRRNHKKLVHRKDGCSNKSAALAVRRDAHFWLMGN